MQAHGCNFHWSRDATLLEKGGALCIGPGTLLSRVAVDPRLR
jgi:hypothetical protein